MNNFSRKKIVFLQEICPDTGNTHLQCYFEFEGRYIRSTITKRLKPITRFHWEVRKKPALACIKYCSKTETRADPAAEPVIYGTPSVPMSGNALGAAQQKGLTEFAEAIRDNKMSTLDVSQADPYTFVKHFKGLERLESISRPPLAMERRICVYYGLSGSGKTRTAYEIAHSQYDEKDIYTFHKLASGTTEWWDGYTGQKCVIVDEMLGSKFLFDRFLQILDRHPVTVPFKGGSTQFAAELIIITSNKKPSEWYGGGSWNILRRRIHECRRFVLVRAPNGKPKTDDEGMPVFKAILDTEEMCPPTNKEYVDFQDEAHSRSGWSICESDSHENSDDDDDEELLIPV